MINNGKITGKVIHIGKEELVGQNSMRKRLFVLEEVSDKEYKGSIVIDLIKDRVDMISKYKIGDIVDVSVNFRANEYNGKFYNGITAWKIDGQKEGSVMKEDNENLPW